MSGRCARRTTLAAAGTRRELLRELEVEVGHADAGRLESGLRTHDVAVLDQAYAARVTLRLGVPSDGVHALRALVAELTSGTAEAVDAGERWVDRGGAGRG